MCSTRIKQARSSNEQAFWWVVGWEKSKLNNEQNIIEQLKWKEDQDGYFGGIDSDNTRIRLISIAIHGKPIETTSKFAQNKQIIAIWSLGAPSFKIYKTSAYFCHELRIQDNSNVMKFYTSFPPLLRSNTTNWVQLFF